MKLKVCCNHTSLQRRIYDEKPDKLSPPNNLKPNGSAGNNSTLDSKPDKQDLVFNVIYK